LKNVSREEIAMTMDRKIRVIAGSFVLASLALAHWVSPWWLLFTAFVGLNLLQSGVTGWCLMEDILRWTGIHQDS
jgi:Inner membrane protein YgaP-like, transmembrane domain